MRFWIIFHLFFTCVFAATLQDFFDGVKKACTRNSAISTLFINVNQLMACRNYSKPDALLLVQELQKSLTLQEEEIESLWDSPPQEIPEIQTETYEQYLQTILQLKAALRTYPLELEKLEKSLGLKNDAEFGSPKHSDGESSEDEIK